MIKMGSDIFNEDVQWLKSLEVDGIMIKSTFFQFILADPDLSFREQKQSIIIFDQLLLDGVLYNVDQFRKSPDSLNIPNLLGNIILISFFDSKNQYLLLTFSNNREIMLAKSGNYLESFHLFNGQDEYIF